MGQQANHRFCFKAEQELIQCYAAVLVKKFSEVRSTNMIISEGLSSFSSDYMTWHWRMSVWPLAPWLSWNEQICKIIRGAVPRPGWWCLPKVTTVPLPYTLRNRKTKHWLGCTIQNSCPGSNMTGWQPLMPIQWTDGISAARFWDISEKFSDCTLGILCLIDIYPINANKKWIVWKIHETNYSVRIVECLKTFGWSRFHRVWIRSTQPVKRMFTQFCQ